MPSEVVSPGTRMLRFLTSTEEWAQRIGNPVTVPVPWPFMLAEIFIAENDLIWMTSVVGIPKSCVKAFSAQGIYLYRFDELPEAIIEVLDRHFVQVEEDLRRKMDSLPPTLKPKLILVKK